jgi:hypothetical protein
MKKFMDSDGVTYTIHQLTALNEKDPILDTDDLQDLNLIGVGEAVNIMDGWVQRIR